MAAALEYHFIYDVLAHLGEGLQQDPTNNWHLKLTPITLKEKKRFEGFLEQKAASASSQSKKEAEQFQEEIKKRLRLVTMIGGQIYKRISDKVNSAKAAAK